MDSTIKDSEVHKVDHEIVHSTPVPKLYKVAATILKKYCNKEGALKSLIYETNLKFNNIQKLFALLSKVISHYSCIENALNTVKLFEEQPKFDRHLAFILTSEVITKNGALLGGCKPISVINSYEKKLRNLLSSSIIQTKKDHPNEELLPRYARINLLLKSEKKVHHKLKKLGWNILEYDPHETSYDEFLIKVQSLDVLSYMKDYHIPNLLLFHPQQQFWQSELYEKNIIILQDKASCLPPLVSGVKSGYVVIDACAAPGNKTSHLASIMANQGRLIAVDRNLKRFTTLEKLLLQRGVTCVETVNKDFTSIDPTEYEDARVILVDPSCSSSGTSVHQDELSKERVSCLASFQLKILSHALSFPNVRTVIYSTCSINEEENESVVEEALSSFDSTFHLEDLSEVLPGWKHFGLPKYNCGPMCLKTNSAVDKCQGFFVAKFIRKKTNKEERNLRKKKNKKKRKFELEEENQLKKKHKCKASKFTEEN